VNLIYKRIEDAHLVFVVQKFFGDVTTNKTAPTGDQNPCHGYPINCFSGVLTSAEQQRVGKVPSSLISLTTSLTSSMTAVIQMQNPPHRQR
jgi:hypothetical protein